jgi:hypothetical protein
MVIWVIDQVLSSSDFQRAHCWDALSTLYLIVAVLALFESCVLARG